MNVDRFRRDWPYPELTSVSFRFFCTDRQNRETNQTVAGGSFPNGMSLFHGCERYFVLTCLLQSSATWCVSMAWRRFSSDRAASPLAPRGRALKTTPSNDGRDGWHLVCVRAHSSPVMTSGP